MVKIRMQRIPVVVGNWKLQKTVDESLELVTTLKNQLATVRDVEIGVAPVFTSLFPVCRRLVETNIGVAGQYCHSEERGAFTGEVSASLLADVGCKYVICGHSERRQLFGDTNESVQRRIRAVLDSGLVAIACVGETESERDEGRTMAQVRDQLNAVFTAVQGDEVSRLIVAYEPVWAIGTGRTATPAQAQEVHAAIRGLLVDHFGSSGNSVRLQYGGSVKPENAAALLSQQDIDGALVGGASLSADSFVAIVKAASSRSSG